MGKENTSLARFVNRAGGGNGGEPSSLARFNTPAAEVLNQMDPKAQRELAKGAGGALDKIGKGLQKLLGSREVAAGTGDAVRDLGRAKADAMVIEARAQAENGREFVRNIPALVRMGGIDQETLQTLVRARNESHDHDLIAGSEMLREGNGLVAQRLAADPQYDTTTTYSRYNTKRPDNRDPSVLAETTRREQRVAIPDMSGGSFTASTSTVEVTGKSFSVALGHATASTSEGQYGFSTQASSNSNGSAAVAVGGEHGKVYGGGLQMNGFSAGRKS